MEMSTEFSISQVNKNTQKTRRKNINQPNQQQTNSQIDAIFFSNFFILV